MNQITNNHRQYLQNDSCHHKDHLSQTICELLINAHHAVESKCESIDLPVRHWRIKKQFWCSNFKHPHNLRYVKQGTNQNVNSQIAFLNPMPLISIKMLYVRGRPSFS